MTVPCRPGPGRRCRRIRTPGTRTCTPAFPSGPISSPSDAAIKAAQNPAEGPWFYFVTVNLDTGDTVFSATYEEQQKAEKKYQQWCKDNPDGGCY
ncbi:endolytic transglycosylase MltG [Microbacterium sp. KUDC0406]|uniref:endolytic transglycosylase MltG n=1 Tax=Microbacterium sp. KUDC0406 TaxID=2909588 RepID=UPI0022A6C475|nr:endolytic transglycosylase MltG [Microbacterium sp. KUDC0406]